MLLHAISDDPRRFYERAGFQDVSGRSDDDDDHARRELTMPAKLRCFVAMAFAHKDTDAIFSALRKTFGPLGVNAQRVARIEHNDNIDTRIISEIEAADLVIADLNENVLVERAR